MTPGNGDEEQRNFQSREDSDSVENRREGDSEGQQESRYGRYNSEIYVKINGRSSSIARFSAVLF